jgi:hypothetical protein
VLQAERRFRARLESTAPDPIGRALFYFRQSGYNADHEPDRPTRHTVRRQSPHEEYTARNQLVRIHSNQLSPVQLEAEVEFRSGKSSGRPPLQADPGAYVRSKRENVSQAAESDALTKVEL